jgi:hypothetical protein
MKLSRFLILIGLFLGLSLSFQISNAISDDLQAISGNVTYNGEPVCAMVLANGEYMFTCSGDGSFDFDVPLDGNGEITVFAFCSGLAPYKQVIGTGEGVGMQIAMDAGEDGQGMDITSTLTAIDADRVNISGNVTFNGVPICAMVLANGVYMFTCSGDGSYSLDVPLDEEGNITLFGFCEGLPPYQKVFSTSDVDPGDNSGGGTDNSDGVAHGSGTDVTIIDGMTFSSNGYFFIPQDGDQMEMQWYQTLEYNNPQLGSSVAEGAQYLWWSGFETFNSVDTLLSYQSEEAFNGTLSAIGNVAYIDNEYRDYKTDFDVDTPSSRHTYIFDPYDVLPLNLVPGDTYSHAFTENEADGSEARSIQMDITDVAYDGVITHFDTYDDCIRYTIEYEDTDSNTGEVYDYEMVFWFCKGVGQVRSIMTIEGEYGITLISDSQNTYN